MLTTWLVVSFPIPPKQGGTYQFGVVTAADEATAQQMVFDHLVTLGLDPTQHSPREVGLSEWFSRTTLFGKTKLYFG